MAKSALRGSDRQPMPGAKSVGRADPAERLEVSVLLRRGNAGSLKQRVATLASRKAPGEHMTRQDFEREYGSASADFDAVRKFAAAHKLAVVQEHAGRRTMVLSGTVQQFNAAFGVELERFEHPGGSYRGRVGSVHLPDELGGVVEAVLGLDNRPAAKPHFRLRRTQGKAHPHAGNGGNTSFTPLQIAQRYNFPAGDGQGQCVGIIELGGGERAADLRAYLSELGIATPPNVTVVSVDHAKNDPTGDPSGPDGEVMLDIEVVGAVAPAAKIAVYFAPNTDAGFLDAITTAIHDATNQPSVLSISWGGPESSWTQQSMTAFDSAFQAAAALGITVCVASGDNGSSDGVSDGADHVDFPASSPYALGVRRHQPANAGHCKRQRDGVERRRAGRRHRRRRQQLLPAARVAERAADDIVVRCDDAAGQSRRAGRVRRCRPGDGIRGAHRRNRHRDRRHERGGAAMGRADRAHQRGERQRRRLRQPDPVRVSHGAERHQAGQQRRLRGERGLGRLHRPRQPERRRGGRAVRRRCGGRREPVPQQVFRQERLNKPRSGKRRRMPKVSTCLWFGTEAEMAARFYVSLVPGSSIEHIQRSPGDWPGGKAGEVILVAFTIGGQSFQGLNGGEPAEYGNAASISVMCADQAEVDRLWTALTADGGSEIMCGWLRDRWGVPWQIVPELLPRLLAGAEPAVARRVFDAMTKMIKLDIATLERAAAG